MKLAIIGSRTCPAIEISKHLPFVPTEIISGGARGADALGADYARSHNIKLTEFLPEYSRFGKFAPLKRNQLIVENCDFLLAFYDGSSKGTAYTINLAQKAGKPLKIVPIGTL